jgi:chromosome segregation ATPase
MRKVAVFLGALAIAGALAVQVAAQASRTPRGGQAAQTGRVADVRERPDNPACQELAELRRELARLQHELRRLQAALQEARRAGNRERAAQIAQEIRRVQAEIQHVQHQIRRLLQECRGR